MATDQQPPQSAANPESPSSRSYGQPVRPAGLDQTTRPASSQLPAESDYASRQYAAQNPAPVPPPRTSSTHKHSPSMPARASSHSRPDGAGKQTTVASNDRVRSSPRFDSGASLQPEHTPKRPRGAEPSQATPPTKKSRDQNPVDNQPDGASNSRGEDLVIKRIVITDPEVDRARMEERAAQSVPSSQHQDAQRSHAGGLAVVGSEGVDDAARVHRQTNGQATSSRRREIRFGDYILGATLGEGEFGKVKMGWKTHGGVQVAVKLIRLETVQTNPNRLPKIYREINILRQLDHPNIVRLHEMVETEKHIGIIMEYASGGELFDYILNHRFLKDPPARRLFAQLISGVGYLHKKGIVHRDLKLENLLLDKHKNIIITDFGFANTFDASDELGEAVERDLDKKDFIQRMALDRVQENGFRRGDLMQTSCGSPCYAAPELVVSESLYTGRKVDVWSCGVILYAMLAGYLPFDDDPDNPEGDNINLLYKYIVTTPLTFPEYVTPHARDLLKRILVANPRTRADLFEVARHSWLEEYSNITSLITSTATDPNTLSQASVDQMQDGSPQLARSASVREPTSRVHQPATPTIGRLIQKQGTVDAQAQGSSSRTQRDAKRRTVQLEYVAPQTQTARTTMDQPSDSVTISNLAQQVIGRRIEQRDTQARQGSRPGTGRRPSTGKEAYPSPSTGNDRQSASAQPQSQRRPSTHENGGQSSSSAYDRPATSRDPKTYQSAADNRASPGPRPGTQGSMMSNLGRSDSTHLASRGSYNRPAQAVAPSLASTTAQGRLSQPPAGRPIFTPSGAGAENAGQSSNSSRTNFEAPSAWKPSAANTHKRSSTLSGLGERLFGKSSSSGAGRLQSSRVASDDRRAGSRIAGAPPTSSQESSVLPRPSRTSTESRRSSFGFARRGSASGDKPKRFSLIPSSFRNLTSGESRGSDGYPPPSTSHSMADPQRLGPDYPIQPRQRPGGNDSDTAFDRPGTSGTISKPARSKESMSRANGAAPERGPTRDTNPEPYQAELPDSRRSNAAQTPGNEDPYADRPLPSAPLSRGYDRSGGGGGSSRPINGGRPGVLHKPNRKFTEAYENEGDGGGGYAFGGQGGHGGGQYGGGSSGAARKVMDFFRRRGRARDGH